MKTAEREYISCHYIENTVTFFNKSLVFLNLPRNCGQSEKLLQQQTEDSHGIEKKVVQPRI